MAKCAERHRLPVCPLAFSDVLSQADEAQNAAVFVFNRRGAQEDGEFSSIFSAIQDFSPPASFSGLFQDFRNQARGIGRGNEEVGTFSKDFAWRIAVLALECAVHKGESVLKV